MVGLLASVILAQAVAGGDVIVRQPDWIRVPTPAEMAQYYPARARGAHTGGRAFLSCKATASGDLAECVVEGVYPGGAGFGQAALKMTPLFKLRPAINAQGEAVGGQTIRIPIVFQTPGGSMDAMTSADTCYGLAAALAEKDPTRSDAWYAARFWTVQAMAMAASAHDRPSSVEHDLSGARVVAAEKVDTSEGRLQMDSCNRAMAAAK